MPGQLWLPAFSPSGCCTLRQLAALPNKASVQCVHCHAVLRYAMLCLQVKITTRRAFDQGELSGAELVQLLHGLARMPRYAPNQGWLAAAAEATLHHLQGMTPGELAITLGKGRGCGWPQSGHMDCSLLSLSAAHPAKL